MDIRLIRAFVTLAQLRRYHAAAERLCLTQPALTKQIQTLEHLTGMTLFQRGRQGAQLTAAGEAIYSQACHFVAQHDQFCARWRNGGAPGYRLGAPTVPAAAN
ncbi:LysR family transcriptional regulator [Raoultella ornithinolytica]|uniref:LysR family transcriptional regulator n=1 Tax=Raoultella ornithinolytica TaxID=54291 RepID=UPI003F75214E